MVKRPLTRIVYPTPWAPASPRPLAIEPVHNRATTGQTKARLRGIVEGFFFWRLNGEDGKHIRCLLIKAGRASSLTCGKPGSYCRYDPPGSPEILGSFTPRYEISWGGVKPRLDGRWGARRRHRG